MSQIAKRLCGVLGVVVLLLAGKGFGAQETTLFSGGTPLLAFTLMPIQFSTPNLGQFCPDFVNSSFSNELFEGPVNLFQRASLAADSVAETSLRAGAESTEKPINLLRSRLISPHCYQAWASVQPGYGLLFPQEEAALSRINGSGVLEPSVIYLRLQLRF
jgi:hypothetical protein